MYKELITITSTGNIEGKKIVSYIQHISAVAVLGTGLFSELNAGLSDFFGARTSLYENKLLDAKDYAVEELAQKAIKLGANGIVGLDVDYTTFFSDVIGVAVNGTAVKLQDADSSEEEYRFQVVNYNTKLPFNLSYLSIVSPEKGNTVCYVEGVCFTKTITAVSGKIRMISPFGDCLFEQDIVFSVNRKVSENLVSLFKSSPIIPGFDTGRIWSSSHVCIYIDKYISDGQIINVSMEDYKFVLCSLEELEVARKEYGMKAVRREAVNSLIIECSCGKDLQPSEEQCPRCKRVFVSKSDSRTNTVSKPIVPILLDKDRLKCPLCNSEMMIRKSCWKCNVQFELDD